MRETTMKQKTSLFCLVLGAAAFIAGCSSKSPTAPPANPTPSAFSISVAASTNTPGINESVLIVAQVTSGGKAVADGTSVTFRTNIGLFAENGKTEVTVATVNGRASATLISVEAGEGVVEVRVPGAVATLAIKFRGSDATDVAISSVLPNMGKPSGGDQVTIFGRGFRAPVKVDFVVSGEARAASNVQVNVDGTQITCVTPTVVGDPVPADVKVTTGAGTTATWLNGFTFATEVGLPLLYKVNPQVGSSAGGYEVELEGKNLTTATVRFSLGAPLSVDRDAVKVSVTADGTLLRVLAPQASPNPVLTDVIVGFVITNTMGSSTYPNVFTYVGDKRPPVVSYLNPDRGSIQGRELVTVYGNYFITPVKVTFVGVGDAEVVAVSPDGTQIQVLTPPVPGGASGTPALPVDVTVVTQAQTGRDETFTLTRAYQYLEGEQPEIYQVSPNSGPIAGGTRVTLTGKGFLSPVQVTFSGAGGNVQAIVSSVNYNQIVCVTPNMGPTNPGAENIASNVVVRNGATGKVSSPQSFRFGSSLFISGVEPSRGTPFGGTTVTIFGQGFVAPVQVMLLPTGKTTGGLAAEVRSVSGTEIVIVTPALPESTRSCGDLVYDVKVTNLDTSATVTSVGAFTYHSERPLITSVVIDNTANNLVPEYLPAGGCNTLWSNHTVHVHGSGFEKRVGTTQSAMTVKFGSVGPVSTTWVSENELTAVLPDLTQIPISKVQCLLGTEIGSSNIDTPVAVTVTNTVTGCVDTLQGAIVIQPCDRSCRLIPTISSLVPAQGTLNGGTAVSILGTNFVCPVNVLFGGAAGAVTSCSPTLVTVTTPPLGGGTAGPVQVTLINSGGYQAISPSDFTYTAMLNVTVLPSAAAGSVSGAGLQTTPTGTLTATPTAPSTFKNWTGDCSPCGTSASCVITMTTDPKACTANFNPGLTVTKVDSGGTGVVTVSPSPVDGSWSCGAGVSPCTDAFGLTSALTLNANNLGATWSGDCTDVPGGVANVTMTDVKACTVTFP